MKTYKNIDEYIKAIPKELTPKIKELRALARTLIPKGEETIRYGMPTIQLNGENLIHFAAMKGHVGFYPTPSGIEPFKEALNKKHLSFSKGCIRFPYDQVLPIPLITKIIKLRIKEASKR